MSTAHAGPPAPDAAGGAAACSVGEGQTTCANGRCARNCRRVMAGASPGQKPESGLDGETSGRRSSVAGRAKALDVNRGVRRSGIARAAAPHLESAERGVTEAASQVGHGEANDADLAFKRARDRRARHCRPQRCCCACAVRPRPGRPPRAPAAPAAAEGRLSGQFGAAADDSAAAAAAALCRGASRHGCGGQTASHTVFATTTSTVADARAAARCKAARRLASSTPAAATGLSGPVIASASTAGGGLAGGGPADAAGCSRGPRVGGALGARARGDRAGASDACGRRASRAGAAGGAG
mmetsp:Transcript_146055/g.468418  ORF Transcript_146055/g.468418 Transcript_146055/m.468418 type:complete len:298 (+) Transcript_146055:5830-6723(+)